MGQRQGSQLVPSEEDTNNPEVAWWCKLLAKIVGVVGAAIAIILGIMTAVSIYPLCIVAGILQVLAACVVLIFEAPVCCQFIDITKPIATFAEKRPYLHKAIIYGVIAIIPLAMCFGLTTLFGSGLIFATGVVYGLMALGKKADREQMRANADVQQTQQMPPSGASAPYRDDNAANLMAAGETLQSNPFAAKAAPVVADQAFKAYSASSSGYSGMGSAY